MEFLSLNLSSFFSKFRIINFSIINEFKSFFINEKTFVNLKKNKHLIYSFWIKDKLFKPILNFFNNNTVKIGIAILGFIFLFKIGETFLGRMSILLYKDIGFSKYDIALYSKTLGSLTTVTFTLIGGILTIRYGTIRSIFIAGFFMAITNLLFALLAWSGKSYLLFAAAMIRRYSSSFCYSCFYILHFTSNR